MIEPVGQAQENPLVILAPICVTRSFSGRLGHEPAHRHDADPPAGRLPLRRRSGVVWRGHDREPRDRPNAPPLVPAPFAAAMERIAVREAMRSDRSFCGAGIVPMLATCLPALSHRLPSVVR